MFPMELFFESALEDLFERDESRPFAGGLELARNDHLDAPLVDLAEGEVALRSGHYERALALASRAAREVAPAN